MIFMFSAIEIFILMIVGVLVLTALFSKSSRQVLVPLLKVVGIIAAVLVCTVLGLRFARFGGMGGLGRITQMQGPRFMVLLPLLGGVVVLIWLLVKSLSTPSGRKTLGILAVVVCIAGLIFAVLAPVAFRGRAVPVPEAQCLAGSMVSGPIWSSYIEEEFAAESYSTPQAAAYGLGARLELGRSPNEILLAEDVIANDLLHAFMRGLQSRYENAEVYIAAPPQEAPREDQVYITLTEPGGEENITITHMMPSINRQGRLEATIQNEKGKTIQSAAFDSRAWLRDYAEFASLSKEGQWLVVGSEEAATSAEEARGRAMEKAADVVRTGLGPSRRPFDLKTAIGPGDLEARGFIVDEYSQKLQGLAGPIWRHAVLLEVSPERMAGLQQHAAQISYGMRMSWARLIGSFVAMIAMICVVYFFLNAATKGYYARSLAVLSVLLAAGLGVIIFMFTA